MEEFYGDDSVVQVLVRAGSLNLAELVVRVPLTPTELAKELKELSSRHVIVVSSGSAQAPDAAIAQFESTARETTTVTVDAEDQRRRLFHAVDGDPQLSKTSIRLSPRELRRFSAA